MPLSSFGAAIARQVPTATFRHGEGVGCEIERHEDRCLGCGRCAAVCPTGACARGATFDVGALLAAPADSRRGSLGAALRRIARRTPPAPVAVPPRVLVFRTVRHDRERCLGCGACHRACPTGAVEARPPAVTP